MARSAPPQGTGDPQRAWDWRLAPKLWAPPAAGLLGALVLLGVLYATRGSGAAGGAAACPPGRPDCGLRQSVHWHADFALIIRGQPFDFGKSQFISREDAELSPAAHIHEGRVPSRSSVVHVHLEQTTWGEFLLSLGFKLDDSTFGGSVEKTCLTMPGGERLCNGTGETFKFFVNGVKVDGIANLDISDLDRVLISFGPETADEARRQFETVTDQACILSEVCSERIDPNEPPEPCSKSSAECH